MAEKKQMKKMPIIPMGRDIEKFLNRVEEEVNKVYDSYDIPYKNESEVEIWEQIGEKIGENKYRIPLDYHQASRLRDQIHFARYWLIPNRGIEHAMEHAFHVGRIIETLHLAESPTRTGSIGGKKNKGRTTSFTKHVLNLISYTSRECELPIPDLTTDDIYNNLAYFEDGNTGIEIEGITKDCVFYYQDGTPGPKSITTKKLREKISKLKN